MIENQRKRVTIDVSNPIIQRGVRDTKVKKFINYLYRYGKPVKAKQISEETGIKINYIRRITQHLGNKITRQYEITPPKGNKPPKIELFLSLNEVQRKRTGRVLLEHKNLKELIKNGL